MKRPMITLGLPAAALLLTSAASAQSGQSAQSIADKGRAMFEPADTNHDGVLTLGEWIAAGHLERGFNIVDANHDGKVTPDELRAAAAKFGR